MNSLLITQMMFLLIYISYIGSSAEALECWVNRKCDVKKENCTSSDRTQSPEYTPLELELCGDDNESSICFATWEIFLNGTVKKKNLYGCFTNMKAVNYGCLSNDECVANGQRKSFIPNTFFCCCEKNRCNENLKIANIVFPNDTNNTSANATATTTTTTPVAVLASAEPARSEAEDAIPYYLVYTVFPISMLLLLVIMYILKKRKYRFNQVPHSDQHTQSNGKLRFVKLEEPIARGKFGAVWKATYKNDVVAVKIMPANEKHPWLTEQEVFRSHHMNHDNILSFIAAEKRGAEYWIVTAYHPMGSLCDYLKTHTITWEQFLRLGFTIARGLTHLHEEILPTRGDDYKPSIAHRDFKSSNILLKNDLTACIADFDLALIFKANQRCGDTHGQVGTRRYMAPEILEGAINFSCDDFLRIDTYAFGLVLWELASRCSSFYPNSVPSYKLPFEAEVGVHPCVNDMLEIVVHQKRRPIIQQSWFHHPGFASLYSCIEESWDHDPEARVSASCVMERFQNHIAIYETSSTPLLYDDTKASDVLNGVKPELTNGYLAV